MSILKILVKCHRECCNSRTGKGNTAYSARQVTHADLVPVNRKDFTADLAEFVSGLNEGSRQLVEIKKFADTIAGIADNVRSSDGCVAVT